MAAPKTKYELHFHGCVQCKRRFGDTCGDAKTKTFSGPCISCRSGRESALRDGHTPHDCCLTSSRLADKNDKKTYRLAGPGAWWLCKVCARQFPIDPRTFHA